MSIHAFRSLLHTPQYGQDNRVSWLGNLLVGLSRYGEVRAVLGLPMGHQALLAESDLPYYSQHWVNTRMRTCESVTLLTWRGCGLRSWRTRWIRQECDLCLLSSVLLSVTAEESVDEHCHFDAFCRQWAAQCQQWELLLLSSNVAWRTCLPRASYHRCEEGCQQLCLVWVSLPGRCDTCMFGHGSIFHCHPVSCHECLCHVISLRPGWGMPQGG